MNNKKREKELKELSQIIVDALTSNREVINHLSDLKERKVIDSSTLLGLALKINDLLEISGTAFAQKDRSRSKREVKTEISRGDTATTGETARKLNASIDGRELTPSQREFERWAMEKFDEKKWLRKAGIIW